MDKSYCVYMHVSPAGKKYIGLTSMAPEERWHNGKGYKNNPYFSAAIEKYGWDNFEHVIIATNLTQEEACKMETELIIKYNTIDINNGYNLTLGGLGALGYHHTDETKEVLREAFSGDKNPFYGKQHTYETKQKISAKNKGKLSGESHPLYGKKRDENVRSKISKSRLEKDYSGEKHPLYGKLGGNNPKAKKVVQIDKSTGKSIKIWDSAVDVQKELGIFASSIYNCCNGKVKSAGGYKWSYKI